MLVPSQNAADARRFGGVLLAAALATAALLVGPAPAQAHADFLGSTPKQGARLADPPTEVVLRFSEDVDPSLTTVVLRVHDQETQKLPVSRGSEPGALVASVPRGTTTAGPWFVGIRVTSSDGHPIQEKVEFVVKEPSGPTASASESPDPSDTASPSDGATSEPTSDPTSEPSSDATTPAADDTANDGGVPVWVILLVAALLVLPLVGFAVVRSSRREGGPQE